MSIAYATITDWFSTSPINKVTKRRKVISIDGIDYTAPAWGGVSEVGAQFNFTASKLFTLWSKWEKPFNCPFHACIKYRVDSRVFRYKLFEHPYSTGTPQLADAYTNQIIRPEFSIELWSVDTAAELVDATTYALANGLPPPSEALTWAGDVTIETSELAVPASNLRDYGSSELATGADAGNLNFSVDAMLPIDNTVGAWNNNTI